MTAAMDQEDSTETEIKKELIEEKNKLDTHENTVKDNLAKTKHWKKEVFIYLLHTAGLPGLCKYNLTQRCFHKFSTFVVDFIHSCSQ